MKVEMTPSASQVAPKYALHPLVMLATSSNTVLSLEISAEQEPCYSFRDRECDAGLIPPCRKLSLRLADVDPLKNRHKATICGTVCLANLGGLDGHPALFWPGVITVQLSQGWEERARHVETSESMQGTAPPTSTSMRATLYAWPEPEPHGLRKKSHHCSRQT